MPSESPIFTPLSILFRPHQKPAFKADRRFLVEAPGTAPGSNRLITKAIYRHSRIKSGNVHIGCSALQEKVCRGAMEKNSAALTDV